MTPFRERGTVPLPRPRSKNEARPLSTRARRSHACAACAIAAVVACSREVKPTPDAAVAVDASPASQADHSLDDASPSLGADLDTAAASWPTGPCPGGPGCDCAADSVCDSGLCAETPSGFQCARTCSGACPASFKCIAVAGKGGDGASFCVPLAPRWCEPCFASKACAEPAGSAGAACIDYGGVNGHFCGAACAADADCPAGATCKMASSVEGTQALQCVRLPDSGGAIQCPCSARAVALGLTTTCLTQAATKPCQGVRQCAAGGVGACTSTPGAPELCDALDNNCNGQTDEGLCDDGQPCTKDVCAAGAACTFAKLDSGACDDGNPCTLETTCQAGQCGGGIAICECELSADCKPFEDDNPCNGTLICNPATKKCEVNPKSVVPCPAANDTACTKNTCNPKTGACEAKPLPDTTPCDDAEFCTKGDACIGGACKSGGDTCKCKADSECADVAVVAPDCEGRPNPGPDGALPT